MNEATLDRWITMRMLTEEVGEADLDGYRITVMERAVEKLHFEDPEFEYVIRITKLRDVAPLLTAFGHEMKRRAAAEEMAEALGKCIPVVDEMCKHPPFPFMYDTIAPTKKVAPKRKAVKPKGKAK